MRLRAGDLGSLEHVVIWNGVLLHQCVEADDKEGWADVQVGHGVSDNLIRTIRLRGKVTIEKKH